MDYQLYIHVYTTVDAEGNKIWRAHYDGDPTDYKESSNREEAISRLREDSPSMENAEVRELEDNGDNFYLVKSGSEYYSGQEPAPGGRKRAAWGPFSTAVRFQVADAYEKAEEVNRDAKVEKRESV